MQIFFLLAIFAICEGFPFLRGVSSNGTAILGNSSVSSNNQTTGIANLASPPVIGVDDYQITGPTLTPTKASESFGSGEPYWEKWRFCVNFAGKSPGIIFLKLIWDFIVIIVLICLIIGSGYLFIIVGGCLFFSCKPFLECCYWELCLKEKNDDSVSTLAKPLINN